MIDSIVDGIRRGTGFGFCYDGMPSLEFLGEWATKREASTIDDGSELETVARTDGRTGLSVVCASKRFKDFPAVEWVVSFSNDGRSPAPVINGVRDMDFTFPTAPSGGAFRLHKVRGAPSNASDNEPSTVTIRPGCEERLGGGAGRSSNKDFPFFRVDTGDGTLIVGVGWSGQWQATVSCGDDGVLRVTAGLELTNFRLNPGESVRGCRMLVLCHQGDPEQSHAIFRRLIWRHYASRAHGAGSISRQPIAGGSGKGAVETQPILFCNTCFTRGGGWLNECNERNQISLIRALAPLGVQAVITDAGWFEGGWPAGAGNWNSDREKYPRGMAPVAAAAGEQGMVYGLWFEPERVAQNTDIDRDHSDWVLRRTQAEKHFGSLLDFALPEVRKFFFGIVEQYLRLPGLKVYRQDFNIDPLPFWRENDEPDRQGIHEMKYIEGLYAYWDMIRTAYPDVFMEECASGGRRTDLETIMRFQAHQKSDYWFDNLVDQASLFALSAYLPNAVISVPLNRLDDYSFHSAMASSLITGWIADDHDFDAARAGKITGVYRSVRHLLNGDWYGLTPWSRDLEHWLVSQYHREDLGEGMILAFRRDHCEPSLTVRLKGLHPGAGYELHSTVTGRTWQGSGDQMMNGLELSIPQAPASELLVYRRS